MAIARGKRYNRALRGAVHSRIAITAKSAVGPGAQDGATTTRDHRRYGVFGTQHLTFEVYREQPVDVLFGDLLEFRYRSEDTGRVLNRMSNLP